MDAQQLYAMLQKIQEPKGYCFYKDKDLVFDLLNSLLTNKERYGYMSCPCRLASGDQSMDSDILCPCVYREPDVKEFGTCYCGLYVSKEWNKGDAELPYVPERRPAEKVR